MHVVMDYVCRVIQAGSSLNLIFEERRQAWNVEHITTDTWPPLEVTDTKGNSKREGSVFTHSTHPSTRTLTDPRLTPLLQRLFGGLLGNYESGPDPH